MLSALRKHITPTTVMAFVALVFAITGGAFAATGGGGSHATLTASSAKAKPKAKTGPRGPAGPAGKNGTNGAPGEKGATGATGPAGPTGGTGPQGNPGNAGTNGENGKEGTPGTNGKGVISTSFEGTNEPAGEPCKKDGGDTVEVEGTGKKSYVCNGSAAGSPETLPEGKTETGAYNARFEGELIGNSEEISVTDPISFNIPLAVPPRTFNYITEAEQEASPKTGPAAKECPGTVEEPEAEAGVLCFYEGPTVGDRNAAKEANELTLEFVRSPGDEAGSGKTGAIATFIYYQGPSLKDTYVELGGSWAVTEA